MIDIVDLYYVFNEIVEKVDPTGLKQQIQSLFGINLVRNSPNYANALVTVDTVLDGIYRTLANVDITLFSPKQEEILKKLHISEYLGKNSKKYIEEVKEAIKANPSNYNRYLTEFRSNLTKTIDMSVQMRNWLEPLSAPVAPLINADQGIIEITFDGKVGIDDFGDAKKQMADWFFIVEGYAKILDIRKEDFEIVGISKASPTTFKIRATVIAVILFLDVLEKALDVQKKVLENIITMEKIVGVHYVESQDKQKFIEVMEKATQALIDSETTEITNKALEKNRLKEKAGDLKNNFSLANKNIVVFINNGGTINVQALNSEIKDQIQIIESKKDTIRQIQQTHELQKSITAGTDSSDIIAKDDKKNQN